MSALVLVDENMWPEFADTVRGVGERWEASSGRVYELALDGRRLEVSSADDVSNDDAVDRDLFELASLVYDRVGGDWSGRALMVTAQLWGWDPEVL